MEGAGFEVVNLGVNNDAQKFIDAVREHQPEIICMSALLTTTMPYMKVVIQALKDEELRDKLFVMVGGAPVTESFARQVGADAYGRDAATAVDLAKAHMARRREQAASPA
jgi:methanogenic corrinoid protein MtbC1